MRLARRIAVVWAIDTLALWLLSFIVPGLELQGWFWAAVSVAVIGLLNALVRPVLLILTLPFTVLSLGLLSVLLNASIVLIAAFSLPGLAVESLVASVWTVLGLAAINTIVTGLLSINDDESFYRNVILRIARRSQYRISADTPGLVIIEIDGLSEPALRKAIDEGHLPTIESWLASDSYRVVEWDCGLPSQTSSSQAGILYGRNEGIPAFRWYEKAERRLFVSNWPGTAREIHRRMSNGTGLLSPQGASLTNLVSGDAAHSYMTMSDILDGDRGVRARSESYFLYFLNPYSFTRTLVRMVWEILRELGQRFRGRLRATRFPATRGGSFPILRAVANVYLRDINLYLLIESMLSGTPIMYSTILGYDVIAHHVGPQHRDSLRSLRLVDEDLQTLQRAARNAPRPYEFVILSDHGQSPGATFEQRYGETLEELVQEALDGRESVSMPVQTDEGWAHLNALLSEMIQAENVTGRAARRVLRRRTHDGYVELGPGREESIPAVPGSDDVVVCTSGNLALIYFTDTPDRLTLETLAWRHPRLIEELVGHEGIGFVMVHSSTRGAVVIGRKGHRYLDSGQVDGEDPLGTFGPNAAMQLKRLNNFPNVGDLVVNSRYDPDTGEVAAFEDLVGSHGGLGGDQMRPFLLFPADWDLPPEPLVGPHRIYRVLRSWAHKRVSSDTPDD